jgi:hypothetical protein
VQVGVAHPHDDGYAKLRPYLDYLQVKDAVAATGEVVPAGQGDGQVLQTVQALAADGYTGFASLEPHLAQAHALGGFSGPVAFGEAARAFAALLAEAGGAHAMSTRGRDRTRRHLDAAPRRDPGPARRRTRRGVRRRPRPCRRGRRAAGRGGVHRHRDAVRRGPPRRRAHLHPAPEHAAAAIAALDAGIRHVILEKPVARDPQQAAAVVAAAQRSTAKIAVCFQNRYNTPSPRPSGCSTRARSVRSRVRPAR